MDEQGLTDAAVATSSRGSAALLAMAACIALAGCGTTRRDTVPKLVLSPGEQATSLPGHDPLQQAVAVVFLEPGMELAVDVISGRLYMPQRPPFPRGYGEAPKGTIGIVDPQLHDQIFAYSSEAIPGEQAWKPTWGKAPAAAPGYLPTWTAPRLVTRAARDVAVVLADGQRVSLETDGRGRIVKLRWATPRGEPLTTAVSYQPGATTISAPAGVIRTYRYDRRNLITEVDAPGAASHARDDTADGLLGSTATQHKLAYRLRSGTAERYAAYKADPKGINENFLDYAVDDGYERYGVPTLIDMRVVDAALQRSGVLDVAEAIPVLNNAQEPYTHEDLLEQATASFRTCRIQQGELSITYSEAVTSEEIASFAERVVHVPKTWIYIKYTPVRSLCGEPR